MVARENAVLELLERQKKLTANQWKIAGAATLGDMLDFFDFFLIGFVLAFIVKEWNLTYGQSGAILLASGVSAPFGSLLYGWMADKVGRRKALITAVLNVSLATGAMALTPEGDGSTWSSAASLSGSPSPACTRSTSL
jgi:MFS transporter, putative metabolite:H+ symporter